MLICKSKNKEERGFKISLKPTGKVVTFKKYRDEEVLRPDVLLTKSEEKNILETFKRKGCEISHEKEKSGGGV